VLKDIVANQKGDAEEKGREGKRGGWREDRKEVTKGASERVGGYKGSERRDG